VIGGNGAGSALKDYYLGTLGNTIAGAIGGVGGGQILQALIPALAGVDVGSVIGQLVGGSVSYPHHHRRTREEHDGGSTSCVTALNPALGVERPQLALTFSPRAPRDS
jgi:hypothetical protein